MKQINIVQYSKPDMDSVYLKSQLYSVFVGKRTVYFGSETQVKRFLSESNRLLNYVLHSANYLYYNLFTEYRKVWFFMDSQGNLKNLNEEINNIINSIDKSFNWLVNRTNSSMNGNANAFSFLEKILLQLLSISNYIKQVLIHKDKFIEIRIIDMYVTQIYDLLSQLNNWGKGMNKKYEFIKENES